ncbi:NAC domain-containing protein [Actinidia chinensis var. chinensis]|uniref:NAC domain-containing protein n=1 Tax=Actinidia chinensis var. chinensis TaxID=1590841 RepID=A0A2R6QPE2_ACTCC|nr:NAC domain-containing protein [Actinidia chinensis var. chinensis]
MAKRLLEGLKFRPTDQELINDYLFNKIIGNELPFDGIILKRDVYDQHKKIVNGETYCRTVGNGTWRFQYSRVINADEYDDESIPIRIKRRSEYIDSGSVQHKNWIIMKFSLAGISLEHPLSSKDYVICRLQKSRGGKHGDEAPVNTPSVVTVTLAMPLPSGHYDILDSTLPFDSMPPLVEAKPAPTVDEYDGYPSGENEIRMQPSIPEVVDNKS